MEIKDLKRIFIGTPGKDYRYERKDKKFDPEKIDPVPWGQRVYRGSLTLPPGKFGPSPRIKKKEIDVEKLKKKEEKKE